VHPGASQGAAPFPKRSRDQIPSIRALSWDARFAPVRKLSIISLNSRPLAPILAGSQRSGILQGDGILFGFNFADFCGHTFPNQPIK